jgi:N-acetylmuramoyl-L-alanine amidase
MKKVLTILTLITLATNAIAANVIEKVRIGENGGNTRLVFQSSISGNIELKKVFQLTNPYRLVIDLDSTEFNYNTKNLKIDDKSNIKAIRQGVFNPSTHRIVLDLNRNIKYKYFKIGKSKSIGERLVIDLLPDGEVEKSTYSPPKTQILQQTFNNLKNKISINSQSIHSSRKSKFVVMIDAGHGGVDPGAVGRISRTKTVYEKTITLAIAKKLADEINKYPNMTAHLTRSNDTFVPLRTRIKRATKKRADLFISIHADAHDNTNVRGGSVYILSENSSDKEAARLARVANRGDEVAGVILKNEARDIQSILIDLTQRESMNKSALLAQDVLKYMKDVVLVKDSKAKFAGFVVLKSADIPSILVESSYISNPTDRAILTNDYKQTKLAQAIAKGTYEYLLKNY